LLPDQDILGDRDSRIRAAPVRALGVLGLADTATILRPLLADKAAEVRWENAFVLGRLKERQAAGPLADDWLRDQQAARRRNNGRQQSRELRR